ncbi:MAG: HAD family phosphatase [Blautia sp.]|nr:HAD family phosphatase [Blautia sp.]MDY5031843.1 HAD family phosphatase [Blautia sp.]
MLKNKKAVLFDLDGTLVDSMGVWEEIDIEYLSMHGLEVPQGLQHEIEGIPFTEVAVYFRKRFQLQESLEEIMQTWLDMAMDKYCYEIPLKKGAGEFVRCLEKQGIRMAVVSSNHLELIRACLEAHGIADCFSVIITADDVEKGKPEPDVYLEAAARLKVKPEECLVFEDIVPGITAGKRAGMQVCAVEDSYSEYQKLEKMKYADYYIHSFEDVLNHTYEG